MCDMCSYHSVKNRGAKAYWDLSEGPKPTIEDERKHP